MKAFLDEEFLLQNEPARRLYHGWAETMPIVDYHCHIDPRDIAEDRRFDNITQVWLGGDHYKWRLIRSNGVPEDEITGNAPDRVKFQRFAEALPRAIGNPLYHWTHLELKRYFGYDGVLTADTAETVWNLCNEKLADPSFSAKNLITRSNVAFVGTTDDPADSLGFHGQIRDSGFSVRVSPSWRPDRAVKIEKPDFADYIRQLGTAAGVTIDRFDRLLEALENRLDFFEKMGCCASDHGLEGIPCREAGPEELEQIFQKALRGESVTPEEKEAYQFAVLRFLGKEYARRDWVMQIHYSAMRNPNSRLFAGLGADTGFDCIDVDSAAGKLAGLLDSLDRDNCLPKTVLYSLNPADNAMLGALIGSFQGPEARGKIQHGSAWWFNDTKTGMEAQLTNLSNLSILGNFIGMLTDSRSLLSYARHEYFRRILCNLIGTWAENGEIAWDEAFLGGLVQDICYRNAAAYFGLE